MPDMPEPGRGRTQGQRVHAGRRTPALLYGARSAVAGLNSAARGASRAAEELGISSLVFC